MSPRGWTPDKDRLLLQTVDDVLAKSWNEIASKLGTSTASQCKRRWEAIQKKTRNEPRVSRRRRKDLDGGDTKLCRSSQKLLQLLEASPELNDLRVDDATLPPPFVGDLDDREGGLYTRIKTPDMPDRNIVVSFSFGQDTRGFHFKCAE